MLILVVTDQGHDPDDTDTIVRRSLALTGHAPEVEVVSEAKALEIFDSRVVLVIVDLWRDMGTTPDTLFIERLRRLDGGRGWGGSVPVLAMIPERHLKSFTDSVLIAGASAFMVVREPFDFAEFEFRIIQAVLYAAARRRLS